jgi:hypothetical protein
VRYCDRWSLRGKFRILQKVYLLLRFSKEIESLKMSIVFCCLKNCFDGIGLSQNNIQRREVNPIVLDTGHMGKFERRSLQTLRLFRHSNDNIVCLMVHYINL